MDDLEQSEETPPKRVGEEGREFFPVLLRVADRVVEADIEITDALLIALTVYARKRGHYVKRPVDKRGHPTEGPHRKVRADGSETCTLCRSEQRRELRILKKYKKLEKMEREAKRSKLNIDTK